jgi:hypothetical protein
MKLVDANLLIYAVTKTAPQHQRSREWLDASLAEDEAVAFDWVVTTAFVRITTDPRLSPVPLPVAAATKIIEDWLAQPASIHIYPTDRHLTLMRELLTPVGTAGNLVNDAHLAALAIEHGATLYSFDNDFSRFPGLRWLNPMNA